MERNETTANVKAGQPNVLTPPPSTQHDKKNKRGDNNVMTERIAQDGANNPACVEE
ncbi:hypothetical protein BV22DRAFT_381302 [Leucogyrophana mollusca]|uniref:Uncharacterized protein n=1 Tax=Leucogyrophana mollusca TaxID=85980 RepID=A0ACB8BKQ2_9AGAM|nr:hypothetical protein BV22DRAFT_381302 [Leucogyrophana mollusca]